ncbi:MAG: metallo-mystery pair system four-Cys motif protein [Candidatus Manganitrophus sp.]|nr:metallo-mystery pair system four-Cys motif protein [Candidatus Manganitrophus sp.]MDC4227722.1 metallo-mystery pair system four-Cys motif protein [Candidatus Manganitrophus sp.]WDT70824.1 MAG: metallo-mystery pair system four-Cys motif protein [Candidatus Manganitrophus sp.]
MYRTILCMNMLHTRRFLFLTFLMASIMNGCSGDSTDLPAAFELRFAATANGAEVGCADKISGVGPSGRHQIGLSDLRFYVSNLRLLDAKGNPIPFTLDENEFQYKGDSGSVALIDLTGNTEGTCAGAAIAFPEGTARTHKAITGKTLVKEVTSVTFDLGVSQPLMKATIANNTAEGAPSPLNEMYWSWASGYRHFVMNFAVEDDGNGNGGDGYLHIGSLDCGPADGKALEDRDACGFVNTPTVALTGINLATDTVSIDLIRAVANLDFISPIYDTTTFEVIGEGPGVECHSSPGQPDCALIFSNFGLDISTGQANSASNSVFSIK